MVNKKKDIRIVTVCTGSGEHRVYGIGVITRNGLILSILGGDRPHVGAISLGIPRQSLKQPKTLSATVSVLTLIGHKDDEVARPLAERLAKKLNQTVVVIAGIHIEKASSDDIRKLTTNSMQIADKLIRKIQSPNARNLFGLYNCELGLISDYDDVSNQ